MMALLLVLVLFGGTQGAVDDHAQRWANHLATTEEFYHSDLHPLWAGSGGPCDWVAENLYRGGDPERRWALYAESPSHARAMSHERTFHGVGVAQSASGTWYVADIFCLVTPEQTQPAPVASMEVSLPEPRPVLLCPSEGDCLE